MPGRVSLRKVGFRAGPDGEWAEHVGLERAPRFRSPGGPNRNTPERNRPEPNRPDPNRPNWDKSGGNGLGFGRNRIGRPASGRPGTAPLGAEWPGTGTPGNGCPRQEQTEPAGMALPRARIMELPVTATPPPPKHPHLQRRAEFLRVAGRGRKLATPGLVLQVLRREDADPARLGFTVTKKVGNAVVRNRTRRRLKEAARLVLAEQPVRGADLVLIGRDRTRARPFAILQDDLRQALIRAGVTPEPAGADLALPAPASLPATTPLPVAAPLPAAVPA
jgi:ribonuclease P protein component